MRFMGGWNCEDYNNAPAKFVTAILSYMNALAASRRFLRRRQPQLSSPAGPPEAFKRIMARM